jgi:hypothetical protein
MRCPKCGFISFDHLASCAKCGRDISEVASELQGTSIKVEVPMFLSGALAALSESEESFEDHAMEADGDEGIDFDMEMEADEEEAGEITAAEEEVDFSFEKEAEEFEVAEEADLVLQSLKQKKPSVLRQRLKRLPILRLRQRLKKNLNLKRLRILLRNSISWVVLMMKKRAAWSLTWKILWKRSMTTNQKHLPLKIQLI